MKTPIQTRDAPEAIGTYSQAVRAGNTVYLSDEIVLTPVHAAPPGRPVLVEARVQRAAIVFRGKRQLIVNAEGLVLRFFHFRNTQLAQFKQAIEQDRYVRAFGEVRRGLLGAEMAHPRYRFVEPGQPLPGTLTPV